MARLDSILRRTSEVDTSGAYTPPAISATVQQVLGGGRGGGGVYVSGTGDNSTQAQEHVLTGRISLGFIGAMIVGAVAFYLWTHQIQGGG